ncbi:RhoGEF domain containing protein, partial [Balamuthia mandrillaris]
ITSKFVRECWFILCSDILVYAYEILNNLQFKGAIALGPTWIRELPDTQVVKNAFQIVSAKKTYTVFAASAEEREDWMTDIQECIDELVKKRPEFKKQRVSIRITKPGLLGNLPAMMGLTYTPEQFDATGVTSKSSTYIPSDSSIYHNDDILLSERAALGDSIPPSLAESDRAPLLGSKAGYGESDGFMAHRRQHSNNSSSDVCCSTCLLM